MMINYLEITNKFLGIITHFLPPGMLLMCILDKEQMHMIADEILHK